MYKEIPFSINLLGYASLGTMVYGVICMCLAIGLPYWEYYDVSLGAQTNITNKGLWRYCIKFEPETSDLTNTCGDPMDIATDSMKKDIQATQAMVILALVLQLVSAVCIILTVFVWKRKLLMHYIAGGIGITAGFFSMFALAIYYVRVKADDHDIHVSTALDIIAWLVAWTSAGFIIYMAVVKKHEFDL